MGLVLVYIFQLQLFYDPFQNIRLDGGVLEAHEYNVFHYIVSKIFRYVLNDGFGLIIIWGLFGDTRYLRFAVFIFLLGLLILLPLYLVLSISFYTSSAAFLNHLHRLVLNPVLMMLLIPAFYYQKSIGQKEPD